MIDRRRGRAAVNRIQTGIRSRRRRPGALVTPRASDPPLHESSSDAQSAKSGISPTAAHGLSAARFLKEWVFQFSHQPSTTRPRFLSVSFPPTYPQRTALCVTAPASAATFVAMFAAMFPPQPSFGSPPRPAACASGGLRKRVRAGGPPTLQVPRRSGDTASAAAPSPNVGDQPRRSDGIMADNTRGSATPKRRRRSVQVEVDYRREAEAETRQQTRPQSLSLGSLGVARVP